MHFWLPLSSIPPCFWLCMATPQEEVTRAWEATVVVKVVRVEAVRDAEASAQEVAVTWESIATVIRDAEDRAALAEREARERVSRVEAESATTLASSRGEVEDLAWWIALFEGGLAEVRNSRDMTEEKSWGLTDTVTDAEWRLEESKRECREQVKELTLLQIRGFELCLTVVGPPRVRSHLLEGMRVATLCYTEMARELAALRTAVSSTAEFTLGHSPNDTFLVEVVDELIAELQR
jgi:hypothetical protein